MNRNAIYKWFIDKHFAHAMSSKNWCLIYNQKNNNTIYVYYTSYETYGEDQDKRKMKYPACNYNLFIWFYLQTNLL